MTHVRRCWRVVTGEDPIDADLRAIPLTHIRVLDVESDGGAERERSRCSNLGFFQRQDSPARLGRRFWN